MRVGGEPIPDLAAFDALWVMGGPMDVWQEAEHPWLKAEKAVIREAVIDRAMPYLGICLGHQLLADALGGVVRPMPEPEIGPFEIELSDAAAGSLLAGLIYSAGPKLPFWLAAATFLLSALLSIVNRRQYEKSGE